MLPFCGVLTAVPSYQGDVVVDLSGPVLVLSTLPKLYNVVIVASCGRSFRVDARLSAAVDAVRLSKPPWTITRGRKRAKLAAIAGDRFAKMVVLRSTTDARIPSAACTGSARTDSNHDMRVSGSATSSSRTAQQRKQIKESAFTAEAKVCCQADPS